MIVIVIFSFNLVFCILGCIGMLYFAVKPKVELKPIDKVNETEFLIGHENQEMTIECDIVGGTLPVTAHIYIDGESRPSKTLPNTNQQYTFFLEPRYHLSRVNCTVWNDAGVAVSHHQIFVLSSKYFSSLNYIIEMFCKSRPMVTKITCINS